MNYIRNFVDLSSAGLLYPAATIDLLKGEHYASLIADRSPIHRWYPVECTPEKTFKRVFETGQLMKDFCNSQETFDFCRATLAQSINYADTVRYFRDWYTNTLECYLIRPWEKVDVPDDQNLADPDDCPSEEELEFGDGPPPTSCLGVLLQRSNPEKVRAVTFGTRYDKRTGETVDNLIGFLMDPNEEVMLSDLYPDQDYKLITRHYRDEVNWLKVGRASDGNPVIEGKDVYKWSEDAYVRSGTKETVRTRYAWFKIVHAILAIVDAIGEEGLFKLTHGMTVNIDQVSNGRRIEQTDESADQVITGYEVIEPRLAKAFKSRDDPLPLGGRVGDNPSINPFFANRRDLYNGDPADFHSGHIRSSTGDVNRLGFSGVKPIQYSKRPRRREDWHKTDTAKRYAAKLLMREAMIDLDVSDLFPSSWKSDEGTACDQIYSALLIDPDAKYRAIDHLHSDGDDLMRLGTTVTLDKNGNVVRTIIMDLRDGTGEPGFTPMHDNPVPKCCKIGYTTHVVDGFYDAKSFWDNCHHLAYQGIMIDPMAEAPSGDTTTWQQRHVDHNLKGGVIRKASVSFDTVDLTGKIVDNRAALTLTEWKYTYEGEERWGLRLQPQMLCPVGLLENHLTVTDEEKWVLIELNCDTQVVVLWKDFKTGKLSVRHFPGADSLAVRYAQFFNLHLINADGNRMVAATNITTKPRV